MIWNFLIEVVAFSLNIVVAPLTLLPDVTLPSEITDALDYLAPFYSAINPVLPVDTILFIIAVIEVPFLLALGTYIVVRWIYQKLPFLN